MKYSIKKPEVIFPDFFNHKSEVLASFKKIQAALVIVLLFQVQICNGGNANLLVDGSFESGPRGSTKLSYGSTNLPGWSIGYSPIISSPIVSISSFQAEDGSKCVDLQGGGSRLFSQPFNVVPGRSYSVCFWMAGNPDGGPTNKFMHFNYFLPQDGLEYLYGGFSFDTTGRSESNMGWTQHTTITLPVPKPSTQMQVEFEAQGFSQYGACIDNVSVTLVPMTFYVNLNNANATPPYTNWLTAATNIQAAIDQALDGDSILVTNGVYATGGRVVYGTLTNRVVINKAVLVQSVNGPAVTAIEGFQTNSEDAVIRCVYLTNGASLCGFTLTNGATHTSGLWEQEGYGAGAWCESQSATLSNCVIVGNVAAIGGGGIYSGTLNNCSVAGNTSLFGDVGGGAFGSVLLNSALTDNLAYISGGGAAGCTLTNCLLEGNWGAQEGGGAYNSALESCIIENNSAGNDGGGIASCYVNDCLILSNTASYYGGGANYSGLLNNCTIVGNSAANGGGASYVTLDNCIVYYNSPENCDSCDLNYCCTFPLSANLGSITNEPMFVNLSGGDFRLQATSPCINAGNNSYAISTNDLDGNPRIVGGTVDIGAYEYQIPSSILSYAWAQQYGLPTDGSEDFVDSDGDGMNNWQEWKAGTNPTNATSVLLLASPLTSVSGITVTWQSVSGISYYLQSSTNLPAFTSIQSNLVGQAGSTSYTDTTATNGGPYFYRVGVQ
jgi:hypothetical protein